MSKSNKSILKTMSEAEKASVRGMPRDVALRAMPGLGRKGYYALLKSAPRVVVTRHRALVELLLERGVITADDAVIEHASADDVRGKHVIGVLPLHLAAEAALVSEVRLDLEPKDRGRELTLDELREKYKGTFLYYVEYFHP